MLFISFIYKMQAFFWGGDKKIPPGGHRRAGRNAGRTQARGKKCRADTGVREEMPGGHRRAGRNAGRTQARGRDKNGRPARRIEKIPPAASAGWQIKKIPPAAPYPEQGRYRAAGFSSLICFCLRTAHLQRKISRCGGAFPMRQAGQNLRLTIVPKVRAA